MREFGIRGWGVGVWLVSGAAAVIGSVALRVVPTEVVRTHPHTSTRTAPSAPYPAESLARVVIARDVFRTDRRPGPIAYDPSRGAAPLPDGPPKPQLVLTGVAWGSEAEAVLEGLPGTPGPRVVRAGDVVGGVTIRRIEHSWLVATGFDTTWTLSVRVPWK